MEDNNPRRLKHFGKVLTVRSDIKEKWGIVLVAIIIHLILPNLILSYGTIFLMKIDNGELAHELILAPCIFTITNTFFEPFFREASETWGSKIGIRLLSIFGILIAFIGVFSSAFIQSPILFSLPFGLLGGIGSCLVISQVKYVMSDIFYTDVVLMQTFYNIGESFGQLAMPFIMMMIINMYADHMGFVELSCFILQLLPVSLFIKNNFINKSVANLQFGEYSRTYKSFNMSNEMTDDEIKEIELSELSKTWKSPSEEHIAIYLPCTVKEENGADVIAIENDKNLSPMGFEILPQIPEESEDSESCLSDFESDIYNSSAKNDIDKAINRMSMISDRFDMFIIKELEEKENEQKKVIINEALSKTKRYKKRFKLKSCCSSYGFHRFKRRCKNNLDYIYDTLFVPLFKSIKIWQFYPAILVQICAIFIPLGFSSLMPYVAKYIIPDLSTNAAIFLLLMHAIGWICFLITAPWIINISKSKYINFIIAGLFASAVELFVIMETSHYYIFVLLSWLIGISNGIIALTYKEVLKETIGVSKWSRIHDTLNRITAIFLIPLMFLIKYILEMHGPKLCFGVFSALQGITCVVISIIPIVTAIRGTTVMWPGI